MAPIYSPVREAQRIFHLLCDQGDQLGLPPVIRDIAYHVKIVSDHDRVYFPIPLKETETASALKAVEGSVACALADLKYGSKPREVKVELEQATCFLFQAYLATVDGLGKLDKGVKAKLKGMKFSRSGMSAATCADVLVYQIPTFFVPSQIRTDGCPQICTRPGMQGNFTTFMDPLRQPKHST